MSQPEHPHTATAADWDERYRSGELPWDTNRPSLELQQAVTSGWAKPGRALELGCGTGTNSIYLAEQHFQVTGLDISPVAIDSARQRGQTAAVHVDFFATDVTTYETDGPYDFVFDRGCYHCVRRVNAPGYLRMIERVTRPGTRFLLLTGNANDESPEVGPPRVSEAELRSDFGSLFDMAWLRPFRFANPDPADASPGYLAWSVGLIRRDA